MKVTATEFRQSLFQSLERALSGESVEVVYKGSVVKLVPAQASVKLERLKRQDILAVDGDSIIGSDPELMTELEAAWKDDWKSL